MLNFNKIYAMQTPPITFIVCISIIVLMLLFKNKLKRKNGPSDDILEPYNTIIAVVVLGAMSVLIADMTGPDYFTKPVVQVARFINVLNLIWILYKPIRQGYKKS